MNRFFFIRVIVVSVCHALSAASIARAEDLTGRDGEADVLHRLDTAEAASQPAHLEHRPGCRRTSGGPSALPTPGVGRSGASTSAAMTRAA